MNLLSHLIKTFLLNKNISIKYYLKKLQNACILSDSGHVAGLLFISGVEKQSHRCTYYYDFLKKNICNWIIFQNLCGLLCPSQQNSWLRWWPPADFLHSFTHTSHPTHSDCNHLEWSEHRGSVFTGGGWGERDYHHPQTGFALYPGPCVSKSAASCVDTISRALIWPWH